MIYFSGFSLQKEQELFDFWLDSSDYCVAGFSYGAIKAVEYTYKSCERIDRLILLSPAFFNNQNEAFKKMQLLYFKKDAKKYTANFLANITSNSNIDLSSYISNGKYQELKELLYYNWNIEKLKTIANRGTTIEVILGENDKIIDSKETLKFFENIAVTYYIKNANHILRRLDDN